MKESLLKGNSICKTFNNNGKKTQVLNSISIDIFEGDFTVIMGPSGAGKSTLLYVLSGMDRISGGNVVYKEQEISSISEKKMAELRAKEFGFIFQQTNLVSNLTLFENVAVAGYVGKIGTNSEVQERAAHLLSQMNVEEARYRLPSHTSGGEAQRAAIARAMINKPGIIFADEPTGALNKSNTEDILNLLSMINSERQSVLLVTHDIRAAIRGTRILYLEDGKILDELILSKYQESDIKEREEILNKWLSSLRW